jgi:hypothetical protein
MLYFIGNIAGIATNCLSIYAFEFVFTGNSDADIFTAKKCQNVTNMT